MSPPARRQPRADLNDAERVELSRCTWATGEWLVPYHDEEWGVPAHDDRRHFELLVLEAAQAGLSWLTVLKRRDGYRQTFAGFDPEAVARFTPRDVEALLKDTRIIRNRQKVESAVTNAAAFGRVQEEFGSFDDYLWAFVGGKPVVNSWRRIEEIPAKTSLSEALSKDLRQRSFRFVGPTVCYAHLQAAGLVMDHLTGCFRYPELSKRSTRRRP